MPVLWGVASVAFLIAGHDQTQLNRVCYFLFFGVFLASGGSNFQEFVSLIISIPLQRMPTYVYLVGLDVVLSQCHCGLCIFKIKKRID